MTIRNDSPVRVWFAITALAAPCMLAGCGGSGDVPSQEIFRPVEDLVTNNIPFIRLYNRPAVISFLGIQHGFFVYYDGDGNHVEFWEVLRQAEGVPCGGDEYCHVKNYYCDVGEGYDDRPGHDILDEVLGAPSALLRDWIADRSPDYECRGCYQAIGNVNSNTYAQAMLDGSRNAFQGLWGGNTNLTGANWGAGLTCTSDSCGVDDCAGGLVGLSLGSGEFTRIDLDIMPRIGQGEATALPLGVRRERLPEALVMLIIGDLAEGFVDECNVRERGNGRFTTCARVRSADVPDGYDDGIKAIVRIRSDWALPNEPTSYNEYLYSKLNIVIYDIEPLDGAGPGDGDSIMCVEGGTCHAMDFMSLMGVSGGRADDIAGEYDRNDRVLSVSDGGPAIDVDVPNCQ